MLRQALFATIAALVAVACHGQSTIAGTLGDSERARLLAAYPGHLSRIEDNELVWRDGTRVPLDDGKGVKSFEDWLDDPDIEDMLAVPYPAGADASPPVKDVDPGRARSKAFFDKCMATAAAARWRQNWCACPGCRSGASSAYRSTARTGLPPRLPR